MREFCTEKAHPADAETVANIMISFGWQLIDSEEFYDENTQVSGVDVKVYGDDFIGGFMKGWTGNDGELKVKTYTTVTNYVTMRFMRDTEMVNYNELCNLQDEFMYNLGEMRVPEKPKKLTIAAVVIALFSIATMISLFEDNVIRIWGIVLPIIVVVGCILLTVFSWRSYKRKEQYYFKVYNKAKSILEKAIRLQAE